MINPCKHENIRVYVEYSHEAKMVDGVVIYDPADAEYSAMVEAICLDCDETFDNVEAIS